MEGLKEDTEEIMKIEMIPWTEYMVKMEDLYTELTVEKIENKPTGPESEVISDYKELFTQVLGSQIKRKRRFEKRIKGQRVVLKADPGLGKATFCKKLAWDWAKGEFSSFSVVFVVKLKFVKSGQSIESILLQNYSSLNGQGVRECDVKQLLDKFGDRCLIVFDGFDEFEGNNEDVMKIIQGRHLRHVSVLLTSRPHSVRDAEKVLEHVIRIDGFTSRHCKKFCSKALKRQDRLAEVLKFHRVNFMYDNQFASPMLLQFICIIANDQDEFLDLTKSNVLEGEIYWRLLRCIYRKFCKHNDILYSETGFVEVMKKLSNFASKLSKSKLHRFQRDEIIREVDVNVFKYGFLVGYQDFALTATDVRVEFLHESVFCYFIMFYFAQRDLSKHVVKGIGVKFNLSVEDKIAATMCALVPVNLHFYLWLLRNKDIVHDGDLKKEKMKLQYTDELNVRTLYWSELFKPLCAGNISVAHVQKDELVLSFLRSVLSKCDKVESLCLSTYDPISWILESLCHLKHKIQLIKVMDPENIEAHYIYSPETFFSAGMKTVVIDALACSQIKHLVNFFEKPFAMFVLADIPIKCGGNLPMNVSELLRPRLEQLHIVGGYYHDKNDLQRKCNMLQDLQQCSDLTNLSFTKVRNKAECCKQIGRSNAAGFAA